MRTTILAGGITLIASVLGFLAGCHSNPPSKGDLTDPNDSPITVSDGSLTIAKTGKFGANASEPTKNYSVKDDQQSVATSISVDGCQGSTLPPGCSSDPSPNLINTADWVLELNDGTQLSQAPQNTNEIDISLSEETMQQPDASGNSLLVISDQHLTKAILSFRGSLENGGTQVATFTCPTSNKSPCKMKIHYCKNKGKCK